MLVVTGCDPAYQFGNSNGVRSSGAAPTSIAAASLICGFRACRDHAGPTPRTPTGGQTCAKPPTSLIRMECLTLGTPNQGWGGMFHFEQGGLGDSNVLRDRERAPPTASPPSVAVGGQNRNSRLKRELGRGSRNSNFVPAGPAGRPIASCLHCHVIVIPGRSDVAGFGLVPHSFT